MPSRRFIRFISRLLIAVLLAAQGLLAAHACDRLGALPMAMAAHESGAMSNPSMSGPEDLPTTHEACGAPTALCHAHCKGDPGTTDSAGPLAVADFVAAFSVAIPAPDSSLRAAAPLEPALTHATSPPASIRHCCWRI